jgi:hypothetical protein
VQEAQLTLVQLPSNDGRGFFFLDPTPNNVASNNVVLQEVTLGAPNNVTSSDFFAPAARPTFVVLSAKGNVLGGDLSPGPRTVDVRAGVQRAVSAQGPRFYQVRLQCAREVWANQVSSALASVSTSVSSLAIGTASGVLAFRAVPPVEFLVTGSATAANISSYRVNTDNPATATITLLVTNPITVSFSAAGSTFSTFFPTTATTITQAFTLTQLGISQSFVITGSTATADGQVAATTLRTNPPNLTQLVTDRALSYTASLSTSFSTSTSVAGTPANAAGFEISQGAGGTCRAEFDKEPATGTGAGPITTVRGPRLDIRFVIPR